MTYEGPLLFRSLQNRAFSNMEWVPPSASRGVCFQVLSSPTALTCPGQPLTLGSTPAPRVPGLIPPSISWDHTPLCLPRLPLSSRPKPNTVCFPIQNLHFLRQAPFPFPPPQSSATSPSPPDPPTHLLSLLRNPPWCASRSPSHSLFCLQPPPVLTDCLVHSFINA